MCIRALSYLFSEGRSIRCQTLPRPQALSQSYKLNVCGGLCRRRSVLSTGQPAFSWSPASSSFPTKEDNLSSVGVPKLTSSEREGAG